MPKTSIPQFNGVAVTAFVLCIIAGGLTAETIHRSTPLIASVLIGLYLLYAIKVVRQWEKVALLRFGHYVGLRGPGIFFITPIVETLTQFVDQRVRVANVSAESTLTRHRAGECGRDSFLDGVERRKGDSGGGELQRCHLAERADSAARIDWPA
ncbi:MAG: hypothetical protein ACLPH3_17965 [Terracidiphilus sp.]